MLDLSKYGQSAMDEDSGRTGSWKRFAKDRRGSIVVIFALVLIPVLAAVGAAIDFSRAGNAKNRLQTSLDAALLAAARDATLDDNQKIAFAQSMFTANFDLGYGLQPATPVITISSSGTVTGTVNASLDTVMLGIVGLTTLQVSAASEVQIATVADGEIVLVLDYSGSMSYYGKYQAMRDAATDFVNQITNNGANTNVKIGLVPFSQEVYGSIESDYIVNEAPGGTWTNCTADRRNSYNIQDTTPVAGIDDSKWGLLCSGGSSSLENLPNSNRFAFLDNLLTNNIILVGDEDDEDEEDEDDEDGGGGGGGGSCDAYTTCSNYPSRSLVIQPLTSDHASVISQLSAMTPYAGTHIALGLAFGWHLISPNPPWTQGVAYNDPDVVKAIVLLSDGDQTIGGWGPGGSNSVSQAESNLEVMCEAIKAQGVTVVTIAFDISPGATEDRLRNCATSTAYFFADIDNGTELTAAFQSIANQLAGALRLTQ
jgi:Flp pilus assembly protein TadG